MEPKQLQVRLLVLRGVAVVALAILTGRLWSLQIAHWSSYDKAAEGNRTQAVWTPAPRGTICDRRGEVLADNQTLYQVQVTARELPTTPTELNAEIVLLATALQASTVEVETALRKYLRVPNEVIPLWRALRRSAEAPPDGVLPDVGESITRLQAIRLDEHRSELPGVRVIETTQRYYPGKTLATHAVGYARAIPDKLYREVRDLAYDDPPGGPNSPLRSNFTRQQFYAPDSIYGQSGVEQMCELVRLGNRLVPALQGRRGVDEFEVGIRSAPRLITRIPPIRGARVYLTLDARLQRVAEEALAHPFIGATDHPSEGGAAVVVDVRTGEILVLASYPCLDPNKWVQGFAPGEYDPNDPTHPEHNRAIASCYPPASTFKMVSGCAVLEQTKVTRETTYHCTGRIYVGARHEPKTCWRPEGHGYVQFDRAVAESCDVYFWETVRQAGLSADEIAAYARKFGLGETTGCGLPTEAVGLVPTPDWKREAQDERWLLGDTINMVIGQGSLTATPLQMAMVTAAVANGGTLLPSRIVERIVWPPEAGLPPATWATPPARSVGVKPETLAAIREGMRLGVVSKNGTGHWLADLPVHVASKTGSAEVMNSRPPHSWFVCFAPYENPRYACAVIVEYGGHGSEVAGNVARQIMQAAFAPATTAAGSGPGGGTGA